MRVLCALTIRDIDDLLHNDLETRVEEIGAVELRLELCRTSENESADVWSVVGDEAGGCHLCDLAQIVVSLLETETSETKGGLTTATVLLGQVDAELVDDGARVSGQRREQRAVSVHDDETELLITLQQLIQSLGVETIVAH